jgi:hypothetical protein
MSALRLTSAALISLWVLVAGLAFRSASVQATVTHEYLSRITEVPASSSAPLTGPLVGVNAMAVDSGKLYLDEQRSSGSEYRLDTFDSSSGAFVSQFPQVPSLSYFYQGIAVGHAAGETEVYAGADEFAPGPEGAIAVFDAAGKLQNVWHGADTPAKAFGCFNCNALASIAVDNSGNPLTKGDVYGLIPEQGVVDVFEPEAGGGEKYVTQLTGPEPESRPEVHFQVPYDAAGIAVDQTSGDLLVVDGSSVEEFEPGPLNTYTFVRRLTGTPAGAFGGVLGVAVDGSNGDIYVADAGALDQFSSTGSYLGRLTGTPSGPFGNVVSMAVDPATHHLYVGDRGQQASVVDIFGPTVVIPDVTSEPAASVKARSATLNGTVNPNEAGSATCRFVWGTSTAFGKEAPCEPEGVASGNSPVVVHAAIGGLQPDTTYYYRLQASNANGTNAGEANQDQEFTTSGPGIHEQSVSLVTSTSATLGAKIDPNNVATTYYFQYGTSATYGTSVPVPPGIGFGAGKGDVAVSVHLQGLTAGTTYHYRVVAVSEPGGELVTVESPDEIFTTQAVAAQVAQPDGRAWELVSPPDKHGAGIYGIGTEQGADIQAAADGGGITYTGTAPFVTNPAGSRSVEMQQAISGRVAPGSWTTADITTPHNEGPSALDVGSASEYKFFSSDLSLGAVEPAGSTPLPPLPAGSEKTIYLREANGAYSALVTSGNVPPGTEVGGNGEIAPGVEFVSASPDLSHAIVYSKVALQEGAPADGGLYEWSAGKLRLVSVLPGNEATSNGLLGDNGDAFGGMVRGAVSNDGSRVIWEDQNQNHYYLRDTLREETLQIDAPQGVSAPPSFYASRYQTASGNGARTFFTSTGRLTPGSTAAEGASDGDLYVFEVTSGGDERLAGKLADLTIDGNASESAHVLGVIGASEDGTYVYFVANGVLGDGGDRGAKSGTCAEGEEASSSQSSCNLYMEHYEASTGGWAPPVFIAALSGEDAHSWGAGKTDLEAMTARVSPNGEHLAFMSERSLTGYENRDANSDKPDEEVFLYDAGSGALVCASCDPTGARPVGVAERYGEEPLWDAGELWSRGAGAEGRGVAGSIPGWTSKSLSTAIYQSRYLADSGRLFFDSSDALVPGDVNGQVDVYEYEPAGFGSCEPPSYGAGANLVYSEGTDGCIGLISAGTSSEESAFLDASETGGDVFFQTTSRLAPQDYDTSFDVYDAHECTPSAPCAIAPALTRPPCTTGDACKSAPTPQPTLFGAPSSETFSGAGNVVPAPPTPSVARRSSGGAKKLARALKACHRRPRGKRASCERRARRRYGARGSRARNDLPAKPGR